jgi:hypothetical protein
MLFKMTRICFFITLIASSIYMFQDRYDKGAFYAIHAMMLLLMLIHKDQWA